MSKSTQISFFPCRAVCQGLDRLAQAWSACCSALGVCEQDSVLTPGVDLKGKACSHLSTAATEHSSLPKLQDITHDARSNEPEGQKKKCANLSSRAVAMLDPRLDVRLPRP